jgi:hypothetical protein
MVRAYNLSYQSSEADQGKSAKPIWKKKQQKTKVKQKKFGDVVQVGMCLPWMLELLNSIPSATEGEGREGRREKNLTIWNHKMWSFENSRDVRDKELWLCHIHSVTLGRTSLSY